MDVDHISEKVAYLVEMFEDLDTDFIEQLVGNNSNSSLEQLIDKCLTENEKNTQQISNNINTITNDNYSQIISLIPASTTSYFDDNDNNNNDMDIKTDNTDNMHVSSTNSLLNSLPFTYRVFFTSYLDYNDIDKIIDIYNHLILMTEQYKYKYSNSNLNYNFNKLLEFNKCIKMVNKLIKNIYKSPNIDKYRTIRESNKSFQNKIAKIDGSQLLLKLCGFDYIKSDNNVQNNGLYIFNSSMTQQWCEILSKFITFYVEQEQKPTHTNSQNPNNSDQHMNVLDNNQMDIPIKKKPKINKLSSSKLREQRLKNLGNYNDPNYGIVTNDNNNNIGPIAGEIINLNQANLRNKLRKIEQKQRKRIFTMKDIEELRKQDFDKKTAESNTSSEINNNK